MNSTKSLVYISLLNRDDKDKMYLNEMSKLTEIIMDKDKFIDKLQYTNKFLDPIRNKPYLSLNVSKREIREILNKDIKSIANSMTRKLANNTKFNYGNRYLSTLSVIKYWDEAFYDDLIKELIILESSGKLISGIYLASDIYHKNYKMDNFLLFKKIFSLEGKLEIDKFKYIKRK